MFNFLWWVPLSAGFQDGINPCVLITSSFTLLILIWLRNNGFKPHWIFIFLISLLLSGFILNCGYLDKFILHSLFHSTVKLFYVLFSVVLGWQGIKFLYQWFQLSKGKKILENPIKIKILPVFLVFLLALTGNVLSVLASLWPINYYISVFGFYLTMPGQFTSMAFYIFIYTFVSLWVVYLIVWFSSLQVKHLRLFKIVSAAILLSASFSVIDLFL